MRFGKYNSISFFTTKLALLPVRPFRHRYPLASLFPHGFTAPDSEIDRKVLEKGKYVYIGSRVLFFRQKDGGAISIGKRVFLNDGIRLETGFGGCITIGDYTHIQSDCQFSAYVGSIRIGKKVQIAPRCAFYPYNHGVSLEESMMKQPLVSRGDIEVKDEAWIGHGAIILEGVTIGFGAVVGAGAVVKNNIPDFALCAGIPAKVLGYRQ